jgi:hypothetical protein
MVEDRRRRSLLLDIYEGFFWSGEIIIIPLLIGLGLIIVGIAIWDVLVLLLGFSIVAFIGYVVWYSFSHGLVLGDLGKDRGQMRSPAVVPPDVTDGGAVQTYATEGPGSYYHVEPGLPHVQWYDADIIIPEEGPSNYTPQPVDDPLYDPPDSCQTCGGRLHYGRLFCPHCSAPVFKPGQQEPRGPDM